MPPFDPSAAAAPDAGVFGLPHDVETAGIVLIPVPFAATVSYGGGSERAPDAILAASRQVDLYDLQFGRVYEHGIHLLPADARLGPAHAAARALATPIIARGGATAADRAAIARIDAAGAIVNEVTYAAAGGLFAQGKVVGGIGGDHAGPYGAIRGGGRRPGGLGILHVDAHADLRAAYEGMCWSHASIMHNVMRDLRGVARLVQVGIRDFADDELAAIHGSGGRIVTHFDQEWRRRAFTGATFDA